MRGPTRVHPEPAHHGPNEPHPVLGFTMSRYPTMDEIADAVQRVVPDGAIYEPRSPMRRHWVAAIKRWRPWWSYPDVAAATGCPWHSSVWKDRELDACAVERIDAAIRSLVRANP